MSFLNWGDAHPASSAFDRAVTEEHPRVMIAVEPNMLAGALSTVLAEVGVYDVVSSDDLKDAYVDAAVVTAVRSYLERADIIIELPDTEGGAGIGRVRTWDGAVDVAITGMGSILDLLDRYCPARPGDAVRYLRPDADREVRLSPDRGRSRRAASIAVGGPGRRRRLGS